MSLPESTGDPPAVTEDMIVAWHKLADDVTAALMQGGEQGMDLLIAVMPEWVEAVDDANAARQICVELSRAGRRHEAILWHAEGFFEAADRLAPERAGWEDWERAIVERGIIVPQVDADLKDEADRIHEELLLRDIGGTSLDEHLVQLRRNVISRGHYGERLTILEAIRGIDPTGDAWEEMIGPIRRKRAGEIMGELSAAISQDDFFTIDRLRREVESTDWGAEVPVAIHGILQATAHWRSLAEGKRAIMAAANALVEQCRALETLDWESPGWPPALQQTMQSHGVYDAYRQNMTVAMREVEAIPSVAARIASSEYPLLLQRLEEDVRPSVTILEERIRWGRIRAELIKVERKISKTNASSPLEVGSWEEVKRLTPKWLQEAGNCRRRADDLAIEHRMALPHSTRQSLELLSTTEKAVRARMKKIIGWERIAIGGVILGILLVVLVLVGIVVSSGLGKSGS